jgi:hypothetical protein
MQARGPAGVSMPAPIAAAQTAAPVQTAARGAVASAPVFKPAATAQSSNVVMASGPAAFNVWDAELAAFTAIPPQSLSYPLARDLMNPTAMTVDSLFVPLGVEESMNVDSTILTAPSNGVSVSGAFKATSRFRSIR